MKLRSLKRGLGGAIDGVACEYFVCDQEEALIIPENFSFADASTLPVSDLTIVTRELCTDPSTFILGSFHNCLV